LLEVGIAAESYRHQWSELVIFGHIEKVFVTADAPGCDEAAIAQGR
jgi:hypothetical protein